MTESWHISISISIIIDLYWAYYVPVQSFIQNPTDLQKHPEINANIILNRWWSQCSEWWSSLPKVSQPVCKPIRIWMQISERNNMLLLVVSSRKWFMGLIPQWELWLLLCRITYLTSQLHCLVPNSWELFYESCECSKLQSHWSRENKWHFLPSASTPGVPSTSLAKKDVVSRPGWHPTE